MKQLFFLIFVLSIPVFCFAEGSPSLADKNRPNILFIAVDDLKPTLSNYGDTIARTPNFADTLNRATNFLNNLGYLRN